LIRDLAVESGDLKVSADVGLIGAGIAGLVLAARLAQAGLRVVVLESGARDGNAATEQLNEVEFAGKPYEGATKGRARGLGGTSTKWGGALLPFFPQDLEPRPQFGLPAWPVPFSDVAPYIVEVERLFRLQPGPYDQVPFADPPQSEDFVARYAKWPSFRLRNVAQVLKGQIATPQGPQIWLNATATGFDLDRDSGRVRAVVATAPSGNTVVVSASRFVICAGAIESTRLLLWLFASANDQRRQECPAAGRWFHDHLSAPLAEIRTSNPKHLNRLAAFTFQGTTMRSLRYELSPLAQRRYGLVSGFCHIAFAPLRRSGIDDVREFMLSLQRRRPDLTALAHATLDAGYLANAAWWRFVHKQLYWPRPSRFDLHVVVEQLPRAANRIDLSPHTDRYGVPRASLDWQVSDKDTAMLGRLAERFSDFWNASSLDGLGSLHWHTAPSAITADSLDSLSDIYHPSGSTRMGTRAEDSVVDANLSVWNVPNLSITATSVFPTIAGANPTMMLLLFTLRLADHLLDLFGKKN